MRKLTKISLIAKIVLTLSAVQAYASETYFCTEQFHIHIDSYNSPNKVEEFKTAPFKFAKYPNKLRFGTDFYLLGVNKGGYEIPIQYEAKDYLYAGETGTSVFFDKVNGKLKYSTVRAGIVSLVGQCDKF